MTEESESLVLEILKKIQNDLATVKDELKANRIWQSSVDSRFNAIVCHLASMHLDMAQVNARIDGLSRRIERLEARLELA
jgi:polyhydroxyalkanoate synthesis regulator phasin